MSQQAAREAAARAFDVDPCLATAEALSVATYGTEDWWTPDGISTRNGFRCCALWVAHVRALDATRLHGRVHLTVGHRPLCRPSLPQWFGTDIVTQITCPECLTALGRAVGGDR